MRLIASSCIAFVSIGDRLRPVTFLFRKAGATRELDLASAQGPACSLWIRRSLELRGPGRAFTQQSPGGGGLARSRASSASKPLVYPVIRDEDDLASRRRLPASLMDERQLSFWSRRRSGRASCRHASTSVSSNGLSPRLRPSASISPSAASSAAPTSSSPSLAPAAASVSRSGRSSRLPSANTSRKCGVVTQTMSAPGSYRGRADRARRRPSFSGGGECRGKSRGRGAGRARCG